MLPPRILVLWIQITARSTREVMIAPCENREGFMMLGNTYYCWVKWLFPGPLDDVAVLERTLNASLNRLVNTGIKRSDCWIQAREAESPVCTVFSVTTT